MQRLPAQKIRKEQRINGYAKEQRSKKNAKEQRPKRKEQKTSTVTNRSSDL
jgi:hypothetical protein